MYQQDSPFTAFKPEKVDEDAPALVVISAVYDRRVQEIRRSYEERIEAAQAEA